MKKFKLLLFLLLLTLSQLFSQTLTVTSVIPNSSYIINGVSTGIGIIAEEVAPLKLRIVDKNSGVSTLYTFTSLNDITVDGVNPTTIEQAVSLINKVTNLGTQNSPYYLNVIQGIVADEFIVTKFGRHATVGTTLTHVSISGFYQTPTTAQTLEILSSDTDDKPSSAGAHKVLIEGLDSNFDIQLDTVTLNGLLPVTLNKQFIRVYRGYVIESGSYVTTSIPSHQGQITLRGTGAGVTWFIIDTVEGTTSGFGIGQTQIGTYTIPRGYTGYLLTKSFSVESNKPASIYFFKREMADDITSPYTGIMRLFEQNDGITTPFSVGHEVPLNVIPGPAEVGFFARVVSTTASVSVEFQLLVKKNN